MDRDQNVDLIPALRHSALGATRVELDQRAAMLDVSLVRGLKRTARGGLAAQTEGLTAYATMHPLKGSGADSAQLWEPWLEAFRWRDRQIVHARMTLTAFVGPTVRTIAQLSAEFPAAPVVSITQGVTSFSLLKSAGSRVDFDFVLQQDKEQVRWHRTVFLPNSSQ